MQSTLSSKGGATTERRRSLSPIMEY